MRALAIVALVLIAPLVAADGEAACEGDATSFHPADEQRAWLDITQRECDGARSYDVIVQDPEGRTHAEWYDDERGLGLVVFRSPRFVYWVEDERGCAFIVNTFGATEMPCPAGAPPSPTQVPR